MSSNFSFDEDKLLQEPAEMLVLFKQLIQKIEEQDIRISELESENKILKSNQENNISVLEGNITSLQSELKKYTSPHIPSSKQLYHYIEEIFYHINPPKHLKS